MALREVNLIDPALIYRRQLIRHLLFWLCCLGGVVLLISGYALYQSRLLDRQRGALVQLENMQTHLGARISEITQIQEELDTLYEQQAAVEKISANISFAKVVLGIVETINDRTWLESLVVDTAGGGDRISVNLTGYSHSSEALGVFLNRLNSSRRFEAISLKFAQKTDYGIAVSEEGLAAERVIHFQIECRVAGLGKTA